MDLNCFRDRLFDLLNDSEGMGIADMNADEQNSLIAVRTESGKVFEIVCREATDRDEVLLKKHRRRFFCRADGWNGQDLTQGVKLQWTASRDGLSSQRTSRKQILERDNRQILIFYGEFLQNLIPSGKTL